VLMCFMLSKESEMTEVEKGGDEEEWRAVNTRYYSDVY